MIDPSTKHLTQGELFPLPIRDVFLGQNSQNEGFRSDSAAIRPRFVEKLSKKALSNQVALTLLDTFQGNSKATFNLSYRPRNQRGLSNQNPIKNAAIAEQALKPVSSKKPAVTQEDPDRLFKVVSRIELQADGSYKHYDGTGRLCLHSHAPEPKEPTYLADNAKTTSRAKSSKSTRRASHD